MSGSQPKFMGLTCEWLEEKSSLEERLVLSCKAAASVASWSSEPEASKRGVGISSSPEKKLDP